MDRLSVQRTTTPASCCGALGAWPARAGGEGGAVAALVAILLPMMLLSMALAIDVGAVLSAKAHLQLAVDAAALSAAQALVQPGADPSAVARQVLGANGVAAADLTHWQVTFPLANTVAVTARRRQPAFFLPAVSSLQAFTIAATATADVNSYAEIPIEPNGLFGKVQQVNPAVFGPQAHRTWGDAYDPVMDDRCSCPNPDAGKLPYGYLFRIDVPPMYPSSQLAVELFDPDSYNSPTPVTSGRPKENTYVQLNAFGPGWHRFYRVDELRPPYGSSTSTCNFGGGPPPRCQDWATTTRFTLWHFDPSITNPFVDPSTIGTKIAEATYGWSDTATDLTWVTPPGFVVNLDTWPRERDGGWYFYLYVKPISGSSENNFGIRTGPPGQVEETNVNDQQNYTWNSGGSMVYIKRAYPWNNTVRGSFWVYLTQVPASAAGQTLLARHFDNDSDNATISYYIEKPDGSLVPVASGKLSGNGKWYASSTNAPDVIQLPTKGDAVYTQVFPAGVNSAWLKALYPVTIDQDTSVWELLYVRARLIR